MEIPSELRNAVGRIEELEIRPKWNQIDLGFPKAIALGGWKYGVYMVVSMADTE